MIAKEIKEKITKRIVTVLNDVSSLEGATSLRNGDDDVGIKAGYFDNYIFCMLLGRFVDLGIVTIDYDKMNKQTFEHLCKLLKVGGENDD